MASAVPLTTFFLLCALSIGCEGSSSLFSTLEPSLQCSACQFVSKHTRTWVHRKGRKWKKMSDSKKGKWINRGLSQVCNKVPQQTCKYNEDGKMVYADFNELIAKGGALEGLSMSEDINVELENVCKEIIKEYKLEIIDGYSSVKTPSKFNIENELCFELSSACAGDEDLEQLKTEL
ncbi:hypothetical protein AAMO2058_001519800 [Amorphochlora amoebiformis]